MSEYPKVVGVAESNGELNIVWSNEDDSSGPTGTKECPKEAKQYIDAEEFDAMVRELEQQVEELRQPVQEIVSALESLRGEDGRGLVMYKDGYWQKRLRAPLTTGDKGNG